MKDINDVTVVVLAGGKGTRLKGLFPDTPKPMIPVAGQPFLHWLTVWIARHGPTDFVYSTGHLASIVEDWALGADLPGIDRQCRLESQPLGTGGGLLNCIDLCQEWVLVTNGDSLVLNGLSELLALREWDTIDGGLIGITVDDASRYGTLSVDRDNLLTGFKEKVPGRGLINSGVYLFRTRLFADFMRGSHSSIEMDIFPALLGRGVRLRVVAMQDAPFIDIGTPETIAQAEQFVGQHF